MTHYSIWAHLAALVGIRPNRGAKLVGRARTLDSKSEGNSSFLTRRLILSSVDPHAAAYAGIRSMTIVAARAAGYALPAYCSDGFIIPYYDSADRLVKNRWRWRNNPEARIGFARQTEQAKYGQPKDAGCYLYLPRVKGIKWQKIIDDSKKDVFVVEGELKALSLCLADILAVAVGGGWNFANKRQLLPELEKFAEGGRRLFILYDSDTRDKPQVAGARYALARALTDAGGKPSFIELPHLKDSESSDKTGADDFIRLNPDIRGGDLRDALLGFANELAEVTELYRLNAEYVIDETTACIVRLYDVETLADRRNENWKRGDFCGLIENRNVPVLGRNGKPSLAPLGALWTRWPARNRVVGRVYRPISQDNKDFLYVYENGRRYLNDFYGWASQPRPNRSIVEELWTPLLESHFRQQSAESQAQSASRLRARNWFEQWWAYPVQHPGAKILSAAVLSGQQGGGKDMVGRAVGQAVYGKHYRLISPAELETEFNASFMEAVSLIHAQELTKKTNKRNFNELLKAWITSSRLFINEKNVKPYYTDAKFNFYMTTNPEDSVHIEGDDRRYFVWRTPDARIQEFMGEKWVLDFHRILVESEEGRAALHYHLLNEVDCAQFDPNAEPPVTTAKQVAKLLSTNEAESYVQELATQQRETNPEGAWMVEVERRKTTFHQKEFIAAFRKYFLNVGRAYVTVTEFGKTRKSRRGLWVLKPTAEDIKANRFVTQAEAKRRYEKSQEVKRA